MRKKTLKLAFLHPPLHYLFSPSLTHSIYLLWHGQLDAYSAYLMSLDQMFIYAYSMSMEPNLPLPNCSYLLSIETFPFADSSCQILDA